MQLLLTYMLPIPLLPWFPARTLSTALASSGKEGETGPPIVACVTIKSHYCCPMITLSSSYSKSIPSGFQRLRRAPWSVDFHFFTRGFSCLGRSMCLSNPHPICFPCDCLTSKCMVPMNQPTLEHGKQVLAHRSSIDNPSFLLYLARTMRHGACNGGSPASGRGASSQPHVTCHPPSFLSVRSRYFPSPLAHLEYLRS